MIFSPDTSNSYVATVDTSAVGFQRTMVNSEYWYLVSNVGCWIKQGDPFATITCVAQASLADTDYVTVAAGTTVLYEFDVAGDGVTGGRIQVNVSTDTTAAQVAERLKTAIEANQPNITVTHDGEGVLTLALLTNIIVVTENVTDAGFLVTSEPAASAADGSMYVPPNTPIVVSGALGASLSVVKDSAAGLASLTRLITF